jgi:hypothetical protein
MQRGWGGGLQPTAGLCGRQLPGHLRLSLQQRQGMQAEQAELPDCCGAAWFCLALPCARCCTHPRAVLLRPGAAPPPRRAGRDQTTTNQDCAHRGAAGRTIRPETEVYRAAHNLLLAHAKAVKVYRGRFLAEQQGCIGITLNCDWWGLGLGGSGAGWLARWGASLRPALCLHTLPVRLHTPSSLPLPSGAAGQATPLPHASPAGAAATGAASRQLRLQQQAQRRPMPPRLRYEPRPCEDKAQYVRNCLAGQRSLEFCMAWFADPIYRGDYPPIMRQRCGSRWGGGALGIWGGGGREGARGGEGRRGGACRGRAGGEGIGSHRSPPASLGAPQRCTPARFRRQAWALSEGAA